VGEVYARAARAAKLPSLSPVTLPLADMRAEMGWLSFWESVETDLDGEAYEIAMRYYRGLL
jgi:hypothetical protein